MGNIESTEVSKKEIESRKDNQKKNNIETTQIPHSNTKFFSKTITSEDTIITDNQDGLVTSQTSLKTLIDEDNNKKSINKQESSSSSSLATPITPLESVIKLKRQDSQSSNSKFSILNLKKSSSMEDLRKLTRSASNSSTLRKLNRKISQSTLFSKLNKKDSQSSSKLSKTALYPNESNNNYPVDYANDYNNNGNEFFYRPPSQNANEFGNKPYYSNNPYTTIPRYSSSNDIENLRNFANIEKKSVNKSPSLEKLKEFTKEKKLFYLKPFRSKSSDNLNLLNNGKKESIFATLTRTKSKNKKNDKYKKMEKNNTTPLPQNPNLAPIFTKTNTVPLFAPIPTTPISPLPFSAVNITSNVNINSNMTVNPFTTPFYDEEERGTDKMNQLKRIFQIEEERKRRKEQEEREKRYIRKETCDSDDFRAFSSTTPISAPPPRKEIDFFQDLDIGRGSRNLNLNLNFDMDDRKYSINSIPLTPTTQYLTTITDLLPTDPAATKEESIKESNDTSFEFDSDDDFLNEVLAPFSKNQMKFNDDEANDNDKKYTTPVTPVTPVTPATPATAPITNYYQHLKKKIIRINQIHNP